MSLLMNKGVYIVAAKRTPFGAFGGAFKSLTAVELGVVATKAALAGLELDPISTAVDACYFGNVIPSNKDAAYTARHIALQSGCSIETPALTINRLCGSGFETIIQAAKSILLNEAQLVIAGGTEQMSQAPLTVRGDMVRWGTALGTGLPLTDSLWDGLTDAHSNTPMGVTAENLAEKYKISRTQCDEYAIQSQQRHKQAVDAGIFDKEMAPITISTKKGDIVVSKDEHPRPESTLEKISKLLPVFKKNGTVTAANASGICDGAGAVIVASEEAVKLHNLTPLCRIVSTAVTGCEPTIMGIGPVSSIRNALAIANVHMNELDRVEINEAFAAQVLACQKELNIDTAIFNQHGGAIALGHPLGASGSRIAAHLANTFVNASSHKYYMGAACIGGGQGTAVLLEKC